MRISWSARALRELRGLRRYIAQTQSDAAARMVERILVAIDRLAMYPHFGRAALWDETGRLRELPVGGTPFVVLYTVDDEMIRILRVFHGAQRREV